MDIIINWLLATLAIGLSAWILPGIKIKGVWSALLVALVLGLLNAVLAPILNLLALPLTFLTLGLFSWVVNALIILLVGKIVPGFEIKSFWWALLFGLVLAVFNGLFGLS